MFEDLLESLRLEESIAKKLHALHESMTWEQIALALYQLLDDISTTDDMAKGNDRAFRNIVMKLQAKKNLYLSSDGYTAEPVVDISSKETDEPPESDLTKAMTKTSGTGRDDEVVCSLMKYNVSEGSRTEAIVNKVIANKSGIIIALNKAIEKLPPRVDTWRKPKASEPGFVVEKPNPEVTRIKKLVRAVKSEDAEVIRQFFGAIVLEVEKNSDIDLSINENLIEANVQEKLSELSDDTLLDYLGHWKELKKTKPELNQPSELCDFEIGRARAEVVFRGLNESLVVEKSKGGNGKYIGQSEFDKIKNSLAQVSYKKSFAECTKTERESILRNMRKRGYRVESKIRENLTAHAEKELELAGLFDKDSDYDGMLGEAVMELMKVFAGQGHSGCSAMMVRELFSKLVNYEPLTEITDDPAEWQAVSEYCGGPASDIVEMEYQSRRNPALFSSDKGKTYWDVNDPYLSEEQGYDGSPEMWGKRPMYTSKHVERKGSKL